MSHLDAARSRLAHPRSSPRERSIALGRRLRWSGKGLFLVPALLYLAALTFYPIFELVRMSVSLDRSRRT